MITDLFDLIPNKLKQRVLDTVVDVVAGQAEAVGGSSMARKIRQLRSDAAFTTAYENGLKKAVERFIQEYEIEDEDLVSAVAHNQELFTNQEVQSALLTMVSQPGKYLNAEQDTLIQSFNSVLPQRKNRERVDKAISYLLRCLAEEMWHLPELQPIYTLQFARMTAEATHEQVALQKAQLAALSSLGDGVRNALLQLTDSIASQKQLTSGSTGQQLTPPKVYHNLPQPDYGDFVGRENELAQISKLLQPYPQSRHHLIMIDGIGGIGKSTLALEVAHCCLQASLNAKNNTNNESADLILLRNVLVERFSEDELRTLCFDMALDYDMLPGEGKGGKARELIAFLDRRHRLGEIIESVQRSRPDIVFKDQTEEQVISIVDERFDAIIWTSAKSNVLTSEGITPRRQIIRTLEDIYTAIAIALQREDITRARPAEQDELVKRALTRQRTLIIIDNLETVDDAAVMSFLRELPAPTKCIVTTRHRIDVAYSIRLVGMTWEDSRTLIKKEGEAKKVFLNEQQARRLYDRTGGLPLAMVWSIAQMGFGDSVESVLIRLGQPTGNVALFCFEEAISKVKGNPSHRLLLSLTLFATDASREALGYIANLPILDRDDSIKELINLSLINSVVRQDSSQSKSKEYELVEESIIRFSILPLTRLFAQQELLPSLEIELRKRQAEFYLGLLNSFSLKDERARYFAQLEGSNLSDLIDFLIQAEEFTLVPELFGRYYPFLWRFGHWARGIKLVLTVINWAEENDDKLLRARCNHWLGRLYLYQGQYFDAERCARQACDLYTLEDWQWISVHVYLAQILLHQERLAEAEKVLSSTLPIALERSDYRGATRIYNAFAEIELHKLNLDKALDYVISGFKMSSGRPEQTTVIGQNYYLRGKIQRKRKSADEAENWVLRFKELADSEGFIQQVAQANLELAQIMDLKELPNRAKELATEAQNTFDRLGMPEEIAECLKLLEQIDTQN